MSLCEVCDSKPFKYRCPRCSIKSCSLECVKQHKLEQDCSGVRCKTAYVPLDSFTDQHLLSDYYFLEEVGRLADSTHRGLVCFNKDNNKKNRNFHWLRTHATKRGTNLKLLPPGMLRHATNTSRTVRDSTKKWTIHWRVHLSFPECSTVYEEESIPESTTLISLLTRYLHPVHSNPLARHRLHHHVTKGGVEGVEVWLEGEGGVAHQLLDIESTLEINLKNKTIVEFPVLHVVTKGAGFPGNVLTRLRESNAEENAMPLPDKGTQQATPLPDKDPPINDGTVTCTAGLVCKEERCDSDWSDGVGSEEGEIVERPVSSLQLIANMYSDSEDTS